MTLIRAGQLFMMATLMLLVNACSAFKLGYEAKVYQPIPQGYNFVACTGDAGVGEVLFGCYVENNTYLKHYYFRTSDVNKETPPLRTIFVDYRETEGRLFFPVIYQGFDLIFKTLTDAHYKIYDPVSGTVYAEISYHRGFFRSGGTNHDEELEKICKPIFINYLKPRSKYISL